MKTTKNNNNSNEKEDNIDNVIRDIMIFSDCKELEDIFVASSVLGILFGDLAIGENFSNIANQINKIWMRSGVKKDLQNKIVSLVNRYAGVMLEVQKNLLKAIERNIKENENKTKENDEK